MRDIHSYIDGMTNHGQVIDELQEVPPRERAGEYLMFRLRTTTGISREEYEKQYLLPFDLLEEVLEGCRQRGHALYYKDRWILTPEGLFLANAIITDLLLAQERSIAAMKRR